MEQYKKMKSCGVSWIGDIPEEWGIKVLFQLSDQVKNKNKNLVEKNLLSLSYGKIKRKDINTSEGLLPESFDGYNIIEANDIVLRLTDLQNDHTSLRVGQATERGIITSAYITIRPSNQINSLYLYYVMHAYDLVKGFYGMGSGVRQGLNFDEIKMLKVPYPDIETQNTIATYLFNCCEKIDEIIDETKLVIEDHKKWKESIIEETVTKGMRKNNKMRATGLEWIEKIPHDWEVSRLKSLFSFGKGLPITKENLTETGVPVISYGQIHAKYNTGTRLSEELFRYVPATYLDSNSDSLVHEGDFLVADTSEDKAGCGNAVYVDKEVQLFGGYHTIILKAKKSDNNKYLAYLFKSNAWRSQIRTRVSGVKLFSVSKKILNDVSIILPTCEEQIEIVNYLDEKCGLIDEIIIHKIRLIEDLELYKRSLVYEVVTGKRKVV